MTAANVIADVRAMLHDLEEASYRWSDALLMQFITWSEQEVRRLRPDLFYNASDAIAEPVAITSTSDTLTLNDTSREVVSNLVAYRALSQDTADSENTSMADRYKKTAYEILGR